MTVKTFELQLAQLAETFSKSKRNIYSDKRKEAHFNELFSLFEAIKNSQYLTLDNDNLKICAYLLKYISNGLEYLDSSTLNVIPFEIVSCLDQALKDWIRTDDFIIVTSLSNKNDNFALETFDSNEQFAAINNHIGATYNLSLTHRLIRIVLPKVLSRDYLSSVVLYHELGHFVDIELNISEKILLKNYGHTNPATPEQQQFYSHSMEYFADIFAAQYISDSSNLYLNYIAYKAPAYPTHPSTDDRIQMVNDFLSNTDNGTITEFNEVLLSSTNSLKIRYEQFKTQTSLIDLIPQKIENSNQLHYIFKCGWDLWLNSEVNFLNQFSIRQRYHVLNNLIEKTISNYFVLESWQNSYINS